MRDHATVFDCFRIVVVGLCKFDVIEWGLKAPVPLLKDLRPNKQCLLVDQNMSQTIYFYSRKLFIYVTNIEKWPAFRLKIDIEKLMVSKNSASQSTSCSKLANRIMKTCFFHPTCSILQLTGGWIEKWRSSNWNKQQRRAPKGWQAQHRHHVVATQTFFMFTPILRGKGSNLTSIFFRWVETT